MGTYTELSSEDELRCVQELQQYLCQEEDNSVQKKEIIAELQFDCLILKRTLTSLARRVHQCDASEKVGLTWQLVRDDSQAVSHLVPGCTCAIQVGDTNVQRNKESTTKYDRLTGEANILDISPIKMEAEPVKVESENIPAITPTKRKRGRPRKDAVPPPTAAKTPGRVKKTSFQTQKNKTFIEEGPVVKLEVLDLEYEEDPVESFGEESDQEFKPTARKRKRTPTVKRKTTQNREDAQDSVLEEPWTCPWCEKEFTTSGEKNNHIQDHLYAPTSYGWKAKDNDEEASASPEKGKTDKDIKKRNSMRSLILQPEHLEELMEYLDKELEPDKLGIVFEDVKCPLCETSFRNRSSLYKHLLDHKKQYKCIQCNKEYANRKRLFAHMREVHKPLELPCPICEKIFVTKNRLRAHIRCHDENRERKHLCTHCGKSFLRQGHLTEHIRGVHQKDLMFKCEICGDELPSKHSYKLHKMDTHSLDPQTSLLCPDCGKSFKSSSSLKLHIKQWHSGNRFKCTYCEETFETHLELYDHFRLHTDKNFICQRCGAGFDNTEELSKHRISAHFSNMRYQCSTCGRGFQYENKLKRHMKTHSGEKVFCEVCNRAFTDPNRMRYHMKRVHQSGLAPCPLCGKEVKAHALNHHIKVVHTDARKKYKCKYCGMKFNTNYNLKRHVLTHTGEKPFQCEYCDKAYTQPHVLKNHHDAMHAGLPLNTSSTNKTTDTNKTTGSNVAQPGETSFPILVGKTDGAVGGQQNQANFPVLVRAAQDSSRQAPTAIITETGVVATQSMPGLATYTHVVPTAAGNIGQQYVVSVFNHL